MPGKTFNAVQAVLSENSWLNQIEGIYQLLVSLIKANTPVDSIVAQVRNSDAYKTRFKGMAIRANKGYAAMTEAEYLQNEDSYKTQLRNASVYAYIAKDEDEFRNLAAQWIGGDVSPAEFSRRIDEGFAAVADSGRAVKKAFRRFYGGFAPSDPALLAYFLDPKKGLREIENEVAAVMVGGAAFEYGLNITRARAEMWSERGVDQEMAKSGFANIAREKPLIEKLARIHNETPLSQSDLEKFFFHENAYISQRRTRLFDEALAQFKEGSFGAGVSSPVNQRGGLTELVDIRRTV
jgi:hypothetical protein